MHESGYANNPKDPGGETNFGINKRAYPKEDIKILQKKEPLKSTIKITGYHQVVIRCHTKLHSTYLICQ